MSGLSKACSALSANCIPATHRKCARRVLPLRRTQRPERWLIVGRFSSDYAWPLLVDYRGPALQVKTNGSSINCRGMLPGNHWRRRMPKRFSPRSNRTNLRQVQTVADQSARSSSFAVAAQKSGGRSESRRITVQLSSPRSIHAHRRTC